MTRTKLGSASRFGPRYGTPLKQVVQGIEIVQKNLQICPQCGKKALKRRGYAMWECKKCGTKMAGGAYAPRTKTGTAIERMIRKGEKVELEQVIAEEKGQTEETTEETKKEPVE